MSKRVFLRSRDGSAINVDHVIRFFVDDGYNGESYIKVYTVGGLVYTVSKHDGSPEAKSLLEDVVSALESQE